jgi:hypothetical protein
LISASGRAHYGLFGESLLPSLAYPTHDGRPAHAVLLGNIGQAHPAKPGSNNGIVVNIERLTAYRQTVELATAHASPDSLLDEVGFEFGDGANDGQEEPPHGTISRDVLAARNELDAEGVQLVHDAQEVLGRTSHTIKGGNNQHGEPPLSGVTEHRIQARATSLAARYTYVGVLRCDLKAPLLGENAEVVKLIVNALVWSGNSGVNRTFLHAKCLLMLSSRILDGAMIGRTWLISSMAAFSNVMSYPHNAY